MTKNCPACGLVNHCQVECFREGGKCWCADIDVPPERDQKIEPLYADTKACLCRACLEASLSIQQRQIWIE